MHTKMCVTTSKPAIIIYSTFYQPVASIRRVCIMYMYVNNIIHITYYTIYPCSALRSYTHFVEFTALICKQRANHLKQSLYLQQQHTQWLDCIACKISRSNLFMPSFDNTIATKIEYKIGEEIIWETKLPDSIHTQNKQSMLALLEKKNYAHRVHQHETQLGRYHELNYINYYFLFLHNFNRMT